MNRDILYLYKGLSAHTKESITSIFKDSPKTLLFAAFLDNETDVNFKSSKAVNYIYQEEQKKEGLAYPILVNRFYKLRQSFRQWLLNQLRNNDAQTAPEERELVFLRFMVSKNEFAYAHEGLVKLAQACRQLCLYELLPEVERMSLFCLQSLRVRDLEAHAQQLLALQEAIDLANQLNLLSYYHMQSFDLSLLADCLEQVRKICTKYPTNIRFQLIYRYTAFFRGVFHSEMNQKSRHVLVRHLNELTALITQHPDIPIISLSNKEQILYRMETAKISFFMHGNDFPQALQCLRMRQKLIKQHPFLVDRKSEPEYRNNIVVLIANELYKEALDEAQAFFKFHQYQTPNQANRAYLEIAYCYIFGSGVLHPTAAQVDVALQGLRLLAEANKHIALYHTEVISAYWWLLLFLKRGQEAADWATQQTLGLCIHPLNYEPISLLFMQTLMEMVMAPEPETIRTLQTQLQEILPQCRPLARLYLYKIVALLQQL